MGQLSVVLGDLTQQHVDAIVNAANSRMRGGGGVDGAIHRAGGPEVLEDCIRRFPNGLPTGQAGWTTAGRLPARWIIHVVGPNYNAGQRDPELLASCYREALRIADELGARSIAFPAVSAGIYGWPLESAAEIAVNTVASTRHAVADVRFVLLFQEVYDAFAAALAARGNS
jgi:O-acetyl-ADP-ribose deacetylase (regulator of RNase III)